jgi:hypothetical protein
MKNICILIIILVIAFSFCSCVETVANLGQEGGTYKGNNYTVNEFKFEKGKKLGKNSNGYNVYSVNNDNEYNFLVVIGDNTDCYVKDSFKIPTAGTVTAVFGDHKATYDKSNINCFEQIVSLTGAEYTFSTDNLVSCGRAFWFSYNDCPVAAGNWIGYMIYTDNKWMFLSNENYLSGRDDRSGGTFIATVITDKKLTSFLATGIIDIRPASYKLNK